MTPSVLHLIDSFEQGGTERLAIQLVRQLHESGLCRVRLACLQNKGSLRDDAETIGLGDIPDFDRRQTEKIVQLKERRL